MRLTRRSLILGVIAALGLDLPSPPRGLGSRGRGLVPGIAQSSTDPASGKLSGPDLENLLAFAEILVEGRPLSPDGRGYLVSHIETRVAQGGGYYLDLYQTTVGLLHRLAGAPFSRLDLAQRIALMTRHRLASPNVRPGEPLGAFPEAMREVRTRAVPDLIAGYYRSPAGWAVVGYATFPGTCGDLARYTSPES